MFGGSIRFSTAVFRSGEYPKSSSYPAHLRNRGKVEQRTTSLTQGDSALRRSRRITCIPQPFEDHVGIQRIPPRHLCNRHIRRRRLKTDRPLLLVRPKPLNPPNHPEPHSVHYPKRTLSIPLYQQQGSQARPLLRLNVFCFSKCKQPRKNARLFGSILSLYRDWLFSRFGGDLLSHVLRRSTIGVPDLNGRVRDGIGCLSGAMTTKPRKKPALNIRMSKLSSVPGVACAFHL